MPSKGDTREVLLTGFNGRNHDHSLHSVTVGPDGKWYFSVGNCGGVFTDKSGKTFRIGASSQDMSWWPKDPERPDRDPKTFGGQKSDDGRVYVGGFIARMNPDGTNVEILAHNLRNSYENCVTSFGDIFANDNDDQPASRTFWVLEGGNYGFASADGSRGWQADRRPGQDIKTATWRQEDPGVAPAGDVYGGGAPTGIVFYENGALGEKWEGTLLSLRRRAEHDLRLQAQAGRRGLETGALRFPHHQQGRQDHRHRLHRRRHNRQSRRHQDPLPPVRHRRRPRRRALHRRLVRRPHRRPQRPR